MDKLYNKMQGASEKGGKESSTKEVSLKKTSLQDLREALAKKKSSVVDTSKRKDKDKRRPTQSLFENMVDWTLET